MTFVIVQSKWRLMFCLRLRSTLASEPIGAMLNFDGNPYTNFKCEEALKPATLLIKSQKKACSVDSSMSTMLSIFSYFSSTQRV